MAGFVERIKIHVRLSLLDWRTTRSIRRLEKALSILSPETARERKIQRVIRSSPFRRWIWLKFGGARLQWLYKQINKSEIRQMREGPVGPLYELDVKLGKFFVILYLLFGPSFAGYMWYLQGDPLYGLGILASLAGVMIEEAAVSLCAMADMMLLAIWLFRGLVDHVWWKLERPSPLWSAFIVLQVSAVLSTMAVAFFQSAEKPGAHPDT